MGRAAGADTLVTLALENGGEQVWRTRFLVDASGRDTFLSNRLDIQAQEQAARQRGDFRALPQCAPQQRRRRGKHHHRVVRATAGSGSFRSGRHHQASARCAGLRI